MKTTLTTAFIALLFSFNCLALSLKEAKTQGLVGEQLNGYLGVIKASPETKNLVTSINEKRKTHYKKIAKKNAISVNDVAKLAAEKAISSAKKGQYIQNKNGEWIKK